MAQLEITYDKKVLGDSYFMQVTVSGAPQTDPVSLRECLVIDIASEAIARIATLTDFEEYSVSANALDWFLPDSYSWDAIPAAGYVIRFLTIPDAWVELGLAAPYDATVLADDAETVPALQFTVPLPCAFTGTVQFEVYYGGQQVGSTHSSRVQIRRYNPNNSGNPLYERVYDAVGLYSSVTEASNKYESLRAEAQSLIDAANIDESTFTGTDIEDYD